MKFLKIKPEVLFLFLAGLGMLAAFFFSCQDPDDDIPVEDPFASYTRILDIGYTGVPSMSDYYSFEEFKMGSHIYFATTNIRYDFKRAKFMISGSWGPDGNETVFESDYKLNIKAVEHKGIELILATGAIYNESPLPYSNPILFVVDDFDESTRIFNWNNGNNDFSGVANRNGYLEGPVLLARNETGAIGTLHPRNEYSLVFLNVFLDSVSTVELPFDSCFVDFFDMKNEAVFRFTGMKIESLTGNMGYVTHMFYAETDLDGNLLVENNLGQMNPGSVEVPDLYYEKIDPLTFYKYNVKDNNVLTLEKYSNTGAKEYSRDIELFQDQPGIEAVCKMEKGETNDDCLIYGYFQQNMDPDPPVFKGNFFIKTNDDGNEDFRVIWHEDFEGHYGCDPHITDIGNNSYVFLYTFFFNTGWNYFITQKLDSSMTAVRMP